MKYSIKPSAKFKKGLKNAVKRNRDISKLTAVVDLLACGKKLPAEYNDHPLKGNYNDKRECHIEPNWLLVYEYLESDLILYLVDTNTHSNLFKK